MRRSITSLILLLITIPVGLAVRLLPLGLPWILYKYLGSALWAIALYWFLAALLPKLRPRAVAHSPSSSPLCSNSAASSPSHRSTPSA